MGASAKFFLTTRELTDDEFHQWYQRQDIIDNWKKEPTDKHLFKDDEQHKKLLKSYLKAKKDFNDYKFNKRHGK